jgi:hypothetical protein
MSDSIRSSREFYDHLASEYDAELEARTAYAGMRPTCLRYFNYETGEERAREWTGQMCVVAVASG